MFDLVIKGGDVIDGTGSPRRRLDVGVVGNRVTALGDLSAADAKESIDASGLIVTPGFIDVHTHLDAQAFWDPTLSPSPLHGVTTVVAGNCGFSIAPLGKRPEDGAYLMKMLSRVEGMPLESLEEGVPWNWDTTEEYLALLDNTLSINAAFKVGHSAIRRVVMGDDATVREATPEEIQRMCGLVRDAIEAGAIGFSSSWSTTHNDTEQRMVPSRYASRAELLALCAVLADYPGTSLEFIPQVGIFTQESIELMAEMSRVAHAPLNWNVLMVGPNNREEVEAKLAASDFAYANGAKVRALTAPMALTFRLCIQSGFLLDAIPGWEETMLLPREEKLAAFRDVSVVARLGAAAAEADYMRGVTNWSKMIIHNTFHPSNKQYEGRNIGEIAAERGQSPWDTLVEIALLDDLQTSFGHPGSEEPDAAWKARVDVWRDPRAVVGASDAGAHLDLFLTANYTTTLLGEAVVKRKLLPLEEAIHYLTAVPSDLYGFKDRGRLTEGALADIVVLDEARVGANPTTFKTDLPAGASRLYSDARGIEHVVCNGREIVRHGEFTSARPGTIVRWGKDTRPNM